MAMVNVYGPGAGLPRGYDYNYFGVSPNQAALQAVPVAAPLPLAATIPSGLAFRHKRVKKHRTRTVVACAQVPFQPAFLVIPHEVAKHFEIKEIRVGQQFAWASNEAIPAEAFSERSFTPFPLALPAVVPGMYIYIRVKNISHSSHHFRAALSGAAPAPCY